MSKSKKITPEDRFVAAALRALVPSGELHDVEGCAEPGVRTNYCHFLAHQLMQATPGAKVVSGWSLEGIRRGGKPNQRYAFFDFHSVVQMPDGRLLCPSTLSGQTIRFVPDPSRTFDMATKISRNPVIFADYVLPDARGRSIPAYTLAWVGFFGREQVFSTDPRFEFWQAFGHGDPFAFAQERGLDPNDLVNMVFCSDIDKFAEAMDMRLGVTPDDVVLTRVRKKQSTFAVT